MWLLLVLFVFGLACFLWGFGKPSNYPPGYWGIPLIGYIPFWNKDLEELVLELHKKHGNSRIVSWKFGTKFIVFLLDHQLVKDAFKRDEFANRTRLKSFGLLPRERNIGFAGNGIQWQNTRKFAINHLRSLGMGKSSLVPYIHYEANELVKVFKASVGKNSHIPDIPFVVAVSNIILQLIGKKRFNYDDERVKLPIQLGRRIVENVVMIGIMDFFPWLSYILPTFVQNILLKQDIFNTINNELTSYLKEYINSCEKSFNESETEATCLIDAYLLKMREEKHNEYSTFSTEDLVYLVADLVLGGTDTILTSLQFTCLYLARYPEVQEKLQIEIDKNFPKGTLPTLEDKSRLPYTECVIHEVIRHSSFVRFVGPREAKCDTVVEGYFIPEGTIMVESPFFINKDKEYWDSPEEFRPERFLDSSGKFFQPKFFMPFGAGKRICPGESLARMELLIFVPAIVQAIHFSTPAGRKIDLEPKLKRMISPPNLDQEVTIALR